MSNSHSLLPLVKRYFETDPIAAAHCLETMTEEEAVEVLKAITPNMAAEAIRYLNDPLASSLIVQLPQRLFKFIINHLDSQQGSHIFQLLSPETRQKFLENLDEKKKREIQELLAFPEDSAGRIMAKDFIAFHGDIKIKDAIGKIRQLVQKGMAPSYIYVIDKDEKLIGIMNMRDMLLATETDLLQSVMRKDVFTVHSFTDREKIIQDLSKRKYFVVPVVDSENRLLGVVRPEQLIDDVQEEASEDLQKMFGAGGDERAFSPISFSLKTRLTWLHVNLVTAFLAAGVVALFEDVIAKITVLAVFLPVVAGQGGNAGAQSLAVVMRGLVMREIPPHKAKDLIVKETVIGVINGLVIGVVTALVAWIWHGNPHLGLVIGLAMLVNLTVAGLSGAVIPLLMKAIHLDPAQCSSIILTTVTDVMGFFAFLGFAVLFQSHLM